jgi:DNA-directed RNA polymerase specialized sigma24 family protein
MSPSTLRRYRAERLLREEFERLRGSVVASVSGRLRAAGVRLDTSDLDAAYAQAWHGLYAAMLEGQEIANPVGWLSIVTYRRAIDEHRARRRVYCAVVPEDDVECAVASAGGGPVGAGAHFGALARNGRSAVQERDLAAELDDRVRLRQLFEALRGRLSAREREAAALCYLQGLSRSEAAARMGVSETRMRKLMEGRGPGSPGVAGKVGALVETIRAGAWCDEQGSLMRGFAYGILDPQGERYRLALLHRSECPACRAYVLSLRGLAAVLPPVPSLLHLAVGAGAIAGKGAGVGAGTGSAAHSGTMVGTGAVAPASSGVGGGALSASASAAAGASAAGGGWLLAGAPVGAKLAVGCLLALGVGAGCVALGGPPDRAGPPHRHDSARKPRASSAIGGYATADTTALDGRAGVTGPANRRAAAPARTPTAPTPITAATRAGREFGPEQVHAAGGARSASARAVAPTASTASSGTASATAAGFSAPAAAGSSVPAAAGSSASAAASSRSSAAGGSSHSVSPAQREFLPG